MRCEQPDPRANEGFSGPTYFSDVHLMQVETRYIRLLPDTTDEIEVCCRRCLGRQWVTNEISYKRIERSISMNAQAGDVRYFRHHLTQAG